MEEGVRDATDVTGRGAGQRDVTAGQHAAVGWAHGQMRRLWNHWQGTLV